MEESRKKLIFANVSLVSGVICLLTSAFIGVLNLFLFIIACVFAFLATSPKTSPQVNNRIAGGFLIGVAGIAISFLSPSVTSAYEVRLRMGCVENLKKIGLAFNNYSKDYGTLPPYDGVSGLNLLVEHGYIKDSKIFTCPSIYKKSNSNISSLNEEYVDYFYKAPSNIINIPDCDCPIMWDKEKNHKGIKSFSYLDAYLKYRYQESQNTNKEYGNVLFRDGHAARFAGKNWQRIAGIDKIEKSAEAH